MGEVLWYYDVACISAVYRFSVFAQAVVCLDGAYGAEVFVMIFAVFAFAAGIYHYADGGEVSGFELCGVGAGLCDSSDDFVAGDHGEYSGEPVVVYLVEVAVADTAVEDLYEYVIGAEVSSFEFPWF